MFKKKGVYHSELVQAGTIEVQITGEPQRSKYQGKPDFIGFKYDGQEHFLTLENDTIRDKLSGLKGQTIQITATGSRDDADVDVYVNDDQDDQEQRRDTRKPAQEARSSQPRKPRQDDNDSTSREEMEARAVKKAFVYNKRAAVLFEISLMNAKVVAQNSEIHPDDIESIRAIATSLFIETCRNVDLNLLPIKLPPAKQEPERRRPRQPEPDLEPEDSDIPF